MLIEDIRSEVVDMYPSERWKKKVSRMSDNQVMAIYFKNRDRKDHKVRLIPKNIPKGYEVKRSIHPEGIGFTLKTYLVPMDNDDQITFDDILRRNDNA